MEKIEIPNLETKWFSGSSCWTLGMVWMLIWLSKKPYVYRLELWTCWPFLLMMFWLFSCHEKKSERLHVWYFCGVVYYVELGRGFQVIVVSRSSGRLLRLLDTLEVDTSIYIQLINTCDLYFVPWDSCPFGRYAWCPTIESNQIDVTDGFSCSWWFRNPANQWWLVVYPTMHRVLYTVRWWLLGGNPPKMIQLFGFALQSAKNLPRYEYFIPVTI